MTRAGSEKRATVPPAVSRCSALPRRRFRATASGSLIYYLVRRGPTKAAGRLYGAAAVKTVHRRSSNEIIATADQCSREPRGLETSLNDDGAVPTACPPDGAVTTACPTAPSPRRRHDGLPDGAVTTAPSPRRRHDGLPDGAVTTAPSLRRRSLASARDPSRFPHFGRPVRLVAMAWPPGPMPDEGGNAGHQEHRHDERREDDPE
jgi:hypothetical protein